MTLEVLQKEMVAAMKSGDKSRKDVIASLVGAVKKAAIDNKCKDSISEDLIANVLLKEQKTAKEMIDTCPASREDLLEKYNFNLSVINKFAPRLVTDPDEVIALIKATSEEQGAEIIKKNRGVFMRALKGKADMSVANQILGSIMKG